MPCLTRPAPVGAWSLSTAACSLADATGRALAAHSSIAAPNALGGGGDVGMPQRLEAPNQMLQQTGEDARS